MVSKMMLMKVAAVAAIALASSAAMADTCIGNCGVDTPNGVVTSPPAYGPGYSYISTDDGVVGAGQIASVGAGSSSATGSEYTTSAFEATAGDALDFYFNYVTADGSGDYSDYSFAELLSGGGDHVAWLFTARTTPTGDTSPGFGLPANDSVLTPSSTPIVAGAPVWAELGSDSGTCFDDGCGYTGWIESNYSIAATGSYQLRFGVTNYGDGNVQSGLAFAGVTVAGMPLPTGAVPEPASWAMMIGGVGLAGGMMRRRRTSAPTVAGIA